MINRQKFSTTHGNVVVDHLDSGPIREVKNRLSVSNTKQMKGLLEVGDQLGKQVFVSVRNDTKITKPLLKKLAEPHPKLPALTRGVVLKEIPDSLRP